VMTEDNWLTTKEKDRKRQTGFSTLALNVERHAWPMVTTVNIYVGLSR
jgi:hypothetical protein